MRTRYLKFNRARRTVKKLKDVKQFKPYYSDLLYKFIVESKVNINGWQPCIEVCSFVVWYNVLSMFEVYATPFFYGLEDIPVQITPTTGEEPTMLTLHMRKTDDAAQDARTYIELMRAQWPMIERIIAALVKRYNTEAK